jgi:hypothetical protein
MIFIDESLPDSRAPMLGNCPPCTGECGQGRQCPGRYGQAPAHPPPDRSTAGGLEPFEGEHDALEKDGLGVCRGLFSACVLTLLAACFVFGVAELANMMGWLLWQK